MKKLPAAVAPVTQVVGSGHLSMVTDRWYVPMMGLLEKSKVPLTVVELPGNMKPTLDDTWACPPFGSTMLKTTPPKPEVEAVGLS